MLQCTVLNRSIVGGFEMTKLTYQAPAIAVLGSFEEITRGTTSGNYLDQSIPAGTPVNQIPGFVDTHLS